MNTQLTNYGRKAGAKKDCSVRALAACLFVSYSEAHTLLKNAGRKENCGMKFRLFAKFADSFGLEMRADLSCMTLSKALPLMSNGRFICCVSKHFFAVVDGAVVDMSPQPEGRRLNMIYQSRTTIPVILTTAQITELNNQRLLRELQHNTKGTAQ